MKKLSVVFFGSPSLVSPVLDSLKENFEVLTYIPNKESLDKEKENLDELNADFFIVAAFGQILPSEILNIPKFGSLNIHPSLLPKYRGPTPVQAAILNGDSVSGVTIIKMDEEVDHGPIFTSKELPISPADTSESFYEKAFKEGAALLIDLIPKIMIGEAKEEPQDDSKASYCEKLNRKSGFFELESPPSKQELERMIRAYYPWPTAWTLWKGKIVKFLPGNRLQMEGKKVISKEEFMRGYPEFPLKN